jgi:CRP-like cAMP-binding protein
MVDCLSRRPARRHDATVLDAVAASPLFAGMPIAEIADVIDEFDQQQFGAGRRIVLEGHSGTDFFLIVEGRAEVMVTGRALLMLEQGDCFGEIGVLSGGNRVATVRAITPLRCLVLANGDLEPLLVDHPRVGVNLLHGLVERFRTLNALRPIEVSPSA